MSEPWQKEDIGDILEKVGIKFEREPERALPAKLFPCKRRISLIGTVGAGKSAVVAGLVDVAEEMVKRTKGTDTPFLFRLQENYTDIYQDVSNLRDGWFPEKTAAFDEFTGDAGLLFEWERHFSSRIPIIGKKLNPKVTHKWLQVPICDFAGEDLIHLARKMRMQSHFDRVKRRKLQRVINIVRQSEGYIVVLKASRAKGFGAQIEKEKDTRLSEDPDVNLVRMLTDLVNFKSYDTSHPIRGMAVVVTAVDKIQPIGMKYDFDLLDPDVGQRDIERFVSSAFKSTYAAIQAFRIPNVRYFPAFFETEKDSQYNEQMFDREIRTVVDGAEQLSIRKSPRIKLKDMETDEGEWFEKVRVPHCSQAQLKAILDWLKGLAVTT